MTFTRGFERKRSRDDRLPPGQYLERGFPVLSAGPTPHTPLEQWTFELIGAISEPRVWTWDELQALPREDFTTDIHCVTTWSKLDTHWTGVSVDTLLDGLELEGGYVTAYCDGGYTTNLPVEDITGGKAWVAFGYDGFPLEPAHGGPARLLVPHLYLWKSAKWVRQLIFAETTSPASGRRSAITTVEIPGLSSVIKATDWRVATVGRIAPETPRAATLTLEVPGWDGHRAGQHVDVRLIAEDGYQAQRRYSIASAPGELDITVVEVSDGEVSPWMVSVAREEDTFEVRGPFGGWFVWDPGSTGPLFFIGGGSGLVPLMSMLRSGAQARLLISARDPDDVLYAEELARHPNVVYTYTRWAPRGWTGYTRRVDRRMLREVDVPGARVYVCGPTPFVESVANDLVALGHDPATIRTERFG